MAKEAFSAVHARMKITCSHGSHLMPCGPDGSLRYVSGETRVIGVPRSASFHHLAARLSEMAGGAEVRAVRHRLADEHLEDVIVSVTCDEELSHMRDEYDRLHATRPAARFRLFVTTTADSSSRSGCGDVQRRRSGIPPLAPKMRRVQSQQALAVSAQVHHRPGPPGGYPVPMRRVQSAQELRARQFLHHPVRSSQCRCVHQRQCPRTAAAAPLMCALPYMSKNARGVSAAKKAATARSREEKSTMDFDKGRAIWEFERTFLFVLEPWCGTVNICPVQD
ncbi:hypothetical protein EJB05_05112, partial [Eragrostis curvula]